MLNTICDNQPQLLTIDYQILFCINYLDQKVYGRLPTSQTISIETAKMLLEMLGQPAAPPDWGGELTPVNNIGGSSSGIK